MAKITLIIEDSKRGDEEGIQTSMHVDGEENAERVLSLTGDERDFATPAELAASLLGDNLPTVLMYAANEYNGRQHRNEITAYDENFTSH